LLAPVVKHDFQMSWALLIISKRSTLLKKQHLSSFSYIYPLTFSTFHLIKVRTGRGGAKGRMWVWGLKHHQSTDYLISVA
jgi:hypothetical protein